MNCISNAALLGDENCVELRDRSHLCYKSIINYDLDITNILVVSAQVRYIEVFDLTNKFGRSPATSLNRGSTVVQWNPSPLPWPALYRFPIHSPPQLYPILAEKLVKNFWKLDRHISHDLAQFIFHCKSRYMHIVAITHNLNYQI